MEISYFVEETFKENGDSFLRFFPQEFALYRFFKSGSTAIGKEQFRGEKFKKLENRNKVLT